jgi:hypothetical protein
MATPIASTNGLQAGAAPAIKVTQNTSVTGQAALNVNYGGKSFATEIIVISEKLYVTGKDKDGKTVFLDTGIKTKETNPEKLKTLAEGYLKSPNPNANVTEFFAKVAPTKVEKKNTVEVGIDLNGVVTSSLTTKVGKDTDLSVAYGPQKLEIGVKQRNFLVPDFEASAKFNAISGEVVVGAGYTVNVIGIPIKTEINYNANSQKLDGRIGATFQF